MTIAHHETLSGHARSWGTPDPSFTVLLIGERPWEELNGEWDSAIDVRRSELRHFSSHNYSDCRGCAIVDGADDRDACLVALSRLRPLAHRLPAIVLADHSDVPFAVRAMQAGAFDVLEMPADPDKLRYSVLEAFRSLEPASILAQRPTSGAARQAIGSLTRRQMQILARILEGQPNKIIAADLGISQRTAENHRAAIMRKMGASSVSSLVQTAIASSLAATDDAYDPADDVAAVAMIDAVPKILEIVCAHTGLRFAAVARVTPERWVACAVRDELGFGLVAGDELKLGTTLCNEIRGHGRPVIIEHVATDERYRDHPTPKQYGFQSYISVPIRHKGVFFGTLCALDTRPIPLHSQGALPLFERMAELIGCHLDLHAQLARHGIRIEVNMAARAMPSVPQRDSSKAS